MTHPVRDQPQDQPGAGDLILANDRTPEEDTLPQRFLNTPLPNDPAATLASERLQELVTEYHRQRGSA